MSVRALWPLLGVAMFGQLNVAIPNALTRPPHCVEFTISRRFRSGLNDLLDLICRLAIVYMRIHSGAFLQERSHAEVRLVPASQPIHPRMLRKCKTTRLLRHPT